MSYELVGRPAGPIARLVSWLDHWRGQPRAGAAGIELSVHGKSLDNVAANETFEEFPKEYSDEIEPMNSMQAARHLKAAVEQLPAQQREMLLLHVNSGLTYREIARRFGMPEQAVLTDLSRAYSQLCVELSMDELRR